MIKTFISSCREDTFKIGETFANSLSGNETILLNGEAGAGKTVFTKGLCRSLLVLDEVLSPTFAFLNRYEGKFPIYHFDLYRLSSCEDAVETGILECFDENGIKIVEWAENIQEFFKFDTININILYTGENSRKIIIEDSN